MSRCFPYPLPGFIGKKASDVSTLIDSIKLQKENKVNKQKRKDNRRDKKENKQTVYTQHHKDSKNSTDRKRKQEDTEQFEGSSVTEEHGQPLNLQNPSYSSDGTQNTNKRRKHSQGHGNIIRIKLPLQKYKESASKITKESDVIAGKEQPCSTSGTNDEQTCSEFVHPGQPVQGDASLTSFSKNNSLKSCPSKELLCSTFGNADDSHTQTSSGDKKMQKKISKYNNLIQSLYQMAVPSVVDGDEDWLFGAKKRNVEKQLPVNSAVTCSGSSALYLEEAKIYALPYTVPF